MKRNFMDLKCEKERKEMEIAEREREKGETAQEIEETFF